MIQEQSTTPRPTFLIEEENLWRVGFHVRSLGLLTHLSGLVDVCEIVFIPEHDMVSLVVKNKDKSGILFGEGSLKAKQIAAFQPQPQDLAVEWPKGQHAIKGGN